MSEKDEIYGFKGLIGALTIFERHNPHPLFPTHCEHDVLYVSAPSPKDGHYTKDELVTLKRSGFAYDRDLESWYSFRFGSS